MSLRALILCEHLQRHLDRYRDRFARRGVEIEAPTVIQQMRESELLPIVGRFEGIVAGDDELTARVLEAGKRLKVIAKWGVGLDAIDVEAARLLGIRVLNTPGVFADEVADVVVGYLVALARGLVAMDRSVRRGGWLKVQGVSLRGRRLGVVGVGSIGRAVAQRGVALGMEVLGHDPVPIDPAFCRMTGMRPVELPALLAESEFVSLHCPLTSASRHLLDAGALERVKRGVYLVNTARGALIDEAALVEALADGRVAGAALDVFEREPLPAESPLRAFEQCIFGTHNASNTLAAVLRTNELAIANLFRGLGVAEPEPRPSP